MYNCLSRCVSETHLACCWDVSPPRKKQNSPSILAILCEVEVEMTEVEVEVTEAEVEMTDQFGTDDGV